MSEFPVKHAIQGTRSPVGRDGVLDVAARLGLRSVSVRKIAEAAGIKAGSIYHHFGSKDEIVAEVLDAVIQVVHESMRQAVSALLAGTGAEAALRAAIEAHLRALPDVSDYTFVNVRIFGQVPQSIRDANLPTRRAYEAEWDTLLSRLEEDGALKSDVDIRHLRLSLMGTLSATLDWFDPDADCRGYFGRASRHGRTSPQAWQASDARTDRPAGGSGRRVSGTVATCGLRSIWRRGTRLRDRDRIGIVHALPCVVIANDATAKGGSLLDHETVQKHIRVQEIAAENRLLSLYLVDCGGAYPPEQERVFRDAHRFGNSFYRQTNMSASGLPQISAVFGGCTAGGAYIPALSDEVIMVRGNARIHLGGCSIVTVAINEEVDGETLGGAEMHARVSDVCAHLAEDAARHAPRSALALPVRIARRHQRRPQRTLRHARGSAAYDRAGLGSWRLMAPAGRPGAAFCWTTSEEEPIRIAGTSAGLAANRSDGQTITAESAALTGDRLSGRLDGIPFSRIAHVERVRDYWRVHLQASVGIGAIDLRGSEDQHLASAGASGADLLTVRCRAPLPRCASHRATALLPVTRW